MLGQPPKKVVCRWPFGSPLAATDEDFKGCKFTSCIPCDPEDRLPPKPAVTKPKRARKSEAQKLMEEAQAWDAGHQCRDQHRFRTGFISPGKYNETRLCRNSAGLKLNRERRLPKITVPRGTNFIEAVILGRPGYHTLHSPPSYAKEKRKVQKSVRKKTKAKKIRTVVKKKAPVKVDSNSGSELDLIGVGSDSDSDSDFVVTCG
ncbi:hypothetical protein EK21DRAFT_117545 [Setomelanomma holmii]|uniref:Uncharacterized protein n=1 Tax=Setomelanomma holmii TaxID=210430 RepID=A0A9P4GZ98_9PLEO|nr:hypothetical protein EK21DRAFT_117545 [Setomelanomma holmii]